MGQRFHPVLVLAALLVATGCSAKRSADYAVNVRHGAFEIHQKHVNVKPFTESSLEKAKMMGRNNSQIGYRKEVSFSGETYEPRKDNRKSGEKMIMKEIKTTKMSGFRSPGYYSGRSSRSSKMGKNNMSWSYVTPFASSDMSVTLPPMPKPQGFRSYGQKYGKRTLSSKFSSQKENKTTTTTTSPTTTSTTTTTKAPFRETPKQPKTPFRVNAKIPTTPAPPQENKWVPSTARYKNFVTTQAPHDYINENKTLPELVNQIDQNPIIIQITNSQKAGIKKEKQEEPSSPSPTEASKEEQNDTVFIVNTASPTVNPNILINNPQLRIPSANGQINVASTASPVTPTSASFVTQSFPVQNEMMDEIYLLVKYEKPRNGGKPKADVVEIIGGLTNLDQTKLPRRARIGFELMDGSKVAVHNPPNVNVNRVEVSTVGYSVSENLAGDTVTTPSPLLISPSSNPSSAEEGPQPLQSEAYQQDSLAKKYFQQKSGISALQHNTLDYVPSSTPATILEIEEQKSSQETQDEFVLPSKEWELSHDQGKQPQQFQITHTQELQPQIQAVPVIQAPTHFPVAQNAWFRPQAMPIQQHPVFLQQYPSLPLIQYQPIVTQPPHWLVSQIPTRLPEPPQPTPQQLVEQQQQQHEHLVQQQQILQQQFQQQQQQQQQQLQIQQQQQAQQQQQVQQQKQQEAQQQQHQQNQQQQQQPQPQPPNPATNEIFDRSFKSIDHGGNSLQQESQELDSPLLRDSYGNFVSDDYQDYDESSSSGANGSSSNNQNSGARRPDTGHFGPIGGAFESLEDLNSTTDPLEMTSFLVARNGGLTVEQFNQLFKEYLTKELTQSEIDDYERRLSAALVPNIPADPESLGLGAYRQQERANGGESEILSELLEGDDDEEEEEDETDYGGLNELPPVSPGAQDQRDAINVQINRAEGHHEPIVKIGYGSSKSHQGVYKSQKFYKKVKESSSEVGNNQQGGSSAKRKETGKPQEQNSKSPNQSEQDKKSSKREGNKQQDASASRSYKNVSGHREEGGQSYIKVAKFH
ncbi:putative mediator of RNA polymerase II transcription subunit 12 [Uranotaenia lowii]|uniref:putative mediator of RNA polymerase II transcription subunit 12 n=1 Tax=Uranotaenia lowii TaxID=190385 RepID=UPI002478E840|nr:putative mediator of RNA polymerase II transcription subunit 12 [Uranotaenia lowii]